MASPPWRPSWHGQIDSDRCRTWCKFGSECRYMRSMACHYYHPPTHLEKNGIPAAAYRARQRSVTSTNAVLRERNTSMMQGLGEAITLDDDDDDNDDDAEDTALRTPCGKRLSITNERVLASYNKIADNAIAVPGHPLQFTPPATPLHIPHTVYRPAYPAYTFGLEPLVRAVQCMAPDVDVLGGTCDLVANAGSLYGLFHFLDGTMSLTTRIDLQWRPPALSASSAASAASRNGAHGTLLLQLWKDDPGNLLNLGYGGRFAAATCRFSPTDAVPDVLRASSFSHHRVLYYELGGLRMAVHCEADGYYCSPDLPPSPPVSPRPSKAVPATGSRFSVLLGDDEDEDDDDDSPGVSSATLAVTFPCGPPTPVPAAHLVEVKTFDARKAAFRHNMYYSPNQNTNKENNSKTNSKTNSNSRKKNKIFARYTADSQLYFARTTQLYEAGHVDGLFPGGVPVNNVAARLANWERDNQQQLRRLVGFLRRLGALAAEHATAAQGHTRFSLILPGTQNRDPVLLSPHEDQRAKLYVRDDGVAFLPECL
ncbi:hypothetical protein SCUCBS95973_005990 [Sporothrix curviconia]|uniref:C3H1-type domain-containing protein n=1 Tax=Sporothrix curviconia TaxID=1260050 RepID=A0ABP0C1H3_9PEZI